MNELALFAGAGGGILGGHLLGWRTVCAVEWEPYAACILAARQNDGLLPSFPIWDDVQTFDGRPWRGIVDVISGGFPCQDISAAGKGAGIDGERSGMWREMARIIHEVRPRFVFVENSPMLTSRGLGTVLGDLAAMGFDARWGVLGAADVGAPHQRDRIWIRGGKKVFYCKKCGYEFETGRITKFGCPKCKSTQPEIIEMANTTQLLCDGGNDNPRISVGRQQVSKPGNNGWKKDVVDTESKRHKQWGEERNFCKKDGRSGYSLLSVIAESSWWKVEPDVGRVADGVAAGVDRLKAIGNGQVPLVAATAWEDLGDQR
jgi:DNA (cytosine-5)-methyltransferase 1